MGLGTDTGGSVRVPSSYCGLWGLRTTHGRVPLRGARALAPSFSTAGLLARDAALLRRAGGALLAPFGPAAAAPLPGCLSKGGEQATPRMLYLSDAFDLALPEGRSALDAALQSPAVERVLGWPAERVVLGDGAAVGGGKTGLEAWFDVFRTIQGFEAWGGYGEWIDGCDVALGPGVRERFQLASKITRGQRDAAAADRERCARLACCMHDAARACAPPHLLTTQPTTS